jgi:demethylmenaquinone methyltransferase/2-methoxy-6-polyprenyl-1,4-benzoquinol methylase
MPSNCRFPTRHFDCITIGFGLAQCHLARSGRWRPCTAALKPGGRVVILEFSHPVAPGLKPAYDLYSFAVLPVLGKLVANDAASYRYLAESIRLHPDQETLLRLMEAAGFRALPVFQL